MERAITSSEHTNRWLVCTLAAHAASRASEPANEAFLWCRAAHYTSGFAEGDPRRAAGYSNAALGSWMLGDQNDATCLIDAASEHWHKSEDWISSLDIPLAATGTAFHLVLAARHGETFTRLRRAKLLALCRGAAAITKTLAQRMKRASHSNALTNTTSNVADIESAFGPNSAEIEVCKRMMTEDQENCTPCELRFLGDRWSDEARRTPPEIRPLVDAAYLTAGLHRLPPMPRSQNHETQPAVREELQ